MRYAFHGKMRMTGQEVDGYVDAVSSSDAIDRLADQGIIGVYTVRPEPLPPKNAITLSGNAPPAIVDLPQMVSTLTQEVARRSVTPMAESGALITLVEKLTTLVGQVEKILARPMPVYTTPVRESNGAHAKRPNSEIQNNALKAIFETNLDLRKSLVKLGSTAAVATPSSPPAPARSSSPEIRPVERSAPARDNGHAAIPRPTMPRGLAVHSV